MLWKMSLNMSSMQLRIWIMYVCFVFILSMSPIVSSFPKGMSNSDSKFSADCKCVNGKCVKEGERDVCSCNPGFGKFRSYCRACECGKGNNCTFEVGFLKDDKYCLCPGGQKLKNEPCKVTCENEGKDRCHMENRVCKDVEGGGYECGSCIPKFWSIFGGEKCEPVTCENIGEARCDIDYRVCKNIEGGGYECGSCIPNFWRIFGGQKCEPVTCENIGKARCDIEYRGCKNIEGGGYECVSCTSTLMRMSDGTCEPVTCENKGKPRCDIVKRGCKDIKGGGYQCESCVSNFLEDNNGNCVSDLCSNNPCRNNGLCKMENGTLSCYCRHPFYGKTCEKEYNPSTIDPTAFISTTSPGIGSTLNISLETTLDISDRTTFIPSDFTDDIEGTSYQPSNFTNYDNLTTAEQWNTTVETTHDPSKFTKDFNITVVPPEFTSDSNVTSVSNQTEPWNTTDDYYRTTKESSNYTQYQTSERPLDFTVEYTKTTDFKDLKTGRVSSDTTPIDITSIPITASTSKPGVEFIFRNFYTIQNLTEIIIKT